MATAATGHKAKLVPITRIVEDPAEFGDGSNYIHVIDKNTDQLLCVVKVLVAHDRDGHTLMPSITRAIEANLAAVYPDIDL